MLRYKENKKHVSKTTLPRLNKNHVSTHSFLVAASTTHGAISLCSRKKLFFCSCSAHVFILGEDTRVPRGNPNAKGEHANSIHTWKWWESNTHSKANMLDIFLMREMNNVDQVFFQNEINNVNTKCAYNVLFHHGKISNVQQRKKLSTSQFLHMACLSCSSISAPLCDKKLGICWQGIWCTYC